MTMRTNLFILRSLGILLFTILASNLLGQYKPVGENESKEAWSDKKLNQYPELNKLITQNNLTACVLILDSKNRDSLSYNPLRIDSAYLPASTFKIPNTLIALEEGAIRGLNDTIKWDGLKRSIDDWNKDQSLKSAFKYSCVWFYQELARRIGLQKYTFWLNKLEYGNQIAGPGIDDFWLQGDIKISARQQITFLKKTYFKEYPFKAKNFDILKKIMLVDSTDHYKLYAKTGWGARLQTQVGWYVGYIESKGRVWFFAANLVIRKEEDSRFRKELVLAALKDLKII